MNKILESYKESIEQLDEAKAWDFSGMDAGEIMQEIEVEMIVNAQKLLKSQNAFVKKFEAPIKKAGVKPKDVWDAISDYKHDESSATVDEYLQLIFNI